MKTRALRFAVDGRQLRAAREKQGISLRRFATQLDVSAATMSGIEAGRTRVSSDRLAHMARLVGSPVERLVAPASAGLATGMPLSEPAHWRVYPPLAFDAPLRGAFDAFVEFGYHGATTREIARRAGMSVPGLYHHYPTKQHMLVAIVDFLMQDLITRGVAARDEGNTPAAKYALLVENLALFHAARPSLSFLGSSELRSLEPESFQRNRRLRRQYKQMMDDATDAAVTAGEFLCDDPRAATQAAINLCVALPTWYRVGGVKTPQEIARKYVGYSLQLLGYSKSRDALIRRARIGETHV